MGRIAVINPKLQIEKSLNAFPNSRDELLQAKALWEAQMEQRTKNLSSGIPLTPELVSYPQTLVEPGVWTERKYMKDKLNPTVLDNGLPGGGYVDFVHNKSVPMGDWDFPDAIHHESSVSVQNVGDVYESLNRYTSDNPNSLWQVYLTPGGVRAFELGERYTPREFAGGGLYKKSNPLNKFAQLNVDENYGKLATNKGNLKPKSFSPEEAQQLVASNDFSKLSPWAMSNVSVDDYGTDLLRPTQAWSARVSGKPGRNEDFVAYPLTKVGSGITAPYNRRIIDTYHDIPIMRSMTLDGMQPGVLPQSGLELLNRHIDSIPSQHRIEIERRLNNLGLI